MTSQVLKRYCSTKIFAMMLLVSALMCARPAAAQEFSGELQGTWRVRVQLVNCATLVPVAPAFESLLSFASGGTLSATTSNAAFQPGQRTSDYGVWRHTRDNLYSAKTEAYILFTSAPGSSGPGFTRGKQRITQAIKVEGDQFTSQATVQFFDIMGAPVATGCAYAVGHRFE